MLEVPRPREQIAEAIEDAKWAIENWDNPKVREAAYEEGYSSLENLKADLARVENDLPREGGGYRFPVPRLYEAGESKYELGRLVEV